MYKQKAPTMAIIALAITLNACGDSSGSGKIVQLIAFNNNIFTFVTEKNSGIAKCNTNNTWASSLSTTTGKTMYAQVLAAQMQKKSVNVTGSGLCETLTNSENPQSINLTD